jgi:tetratricopeptide (TPR) repeat protein
VRQAGSGGPASDCWDVMLETRQRRGATGPGPAAVRAWLCLLVVLCCRPTGAADAAQSRVDGRAALEAAVALVQQGQLADADREAQRALGDPETRAVANSILGTIRLQQNRLEDSAGLLREAIRLEPRLVGAQLSLAQVYTRQNKPELALARFQAVLELDPGNPSARLAVARVALEKGNYQRALMLTEPVRSALRQSPEGLYVVTAALLKSGQREQAAPLAADWKRLTNVPHAASIAFGLLLVQDGAIDEGIDVLEHAGKTGPPSYELAFNLAGAYLLKKNAARALEQYDAALSIRPDSLDALRLAAGEGERNGELERSLSYWLRAKKLAPDDPAVLLGFGRVCFKLDLLEDAEVALAKAASLKPGDIRYQYTLAAVKVGRRQYDEARGLLQPLVEAHPRDPHLQYAMGTILYTQGQLEEAAAHLRESIRLEPDQLPSYYYLALVARDQGRHDEAMSTLEQLLVKHPDHAGANEVLGMLLMGVRRHAEAETRLRAAVRLNPASVKANYQLGLLLARVGKKEESEQRLAHAKTLRQEDEASSRLQLRLMDPEP